MVRLSKPSHSWMWYSCFLLNSCHTCSLKVSSLLIYTFVVSRAFMAGAASQAGDADSSRAPGLTSGLQGSVNVHRGALLLVPQWQCISSFVFYIVVGQLHVLTDLSKNFKIWCVLMTHTNTIFEIGLCMIQKYEQLLAQQFQQSLTWQKQDGKNLHVNIVLVPTPRRSGTLVCIYCNSWELSKLINFAALSCFFPFLCMFNSSLDIQ